MRRILQVGPRGLLLIGVAVALAVLVLPAGGGAALAQPTSVQVEDDEGVSFSQVDFTWTGATTLNSDTGRVDVNIAELQASTLMSSGFINVVTGSGWVVRNLPVFPDFPYPIISTNFDLDSTVGVDVTSLDAYVEFLSHPVSTDPVGSLTPFVVGDTDYNAEGLGLDPVTGGPPIPPAAIGFQSGPLTVGIQTGHPTLETRTNQCLPAAVATSFQWLEDTYGIFVPHPNDPGENGDGTLVGELDVEMNRDPGDGTTPRNGLKGKLCYLAHNGLNDIEVKHQGALWDLVTGDVTECGMTSSWQGDEVTGIFLAREVAKGEDVEMGFTYPGGGGHMVEVVAAGSMYGLPWVAYQSDHVQSINSVGTGKVDFSYLWDTPDADTHLNLVNEPWLPNARILFTQSVPSPIGGIADLPPVAETSAEGSAAPADGSGWTAGAYAALAGGLAAALMAFGGGAWYARRRFSRS